MLPIHSGICRSVSGPSHSHLPLSNGEYREAISFVLHDQVITSATFLRSVIKLIRSVESNSLILFPDKIFTSQYHEFKRKLIQHIDAPCLRYLIGKNLIVNLLNYKLYFIYSSTILGVVQGTYTFVPASSHSKSVDDFKPLGNVTKKAQ